MQAELRKEAKGTEWRGQPVAGIVRGAQVSLAGSWTWTPPRSGNEESAGVRTRLRGAWSRSSLSCCCLHNCSGTWAAQDPRADHTQTHGGATAGVTVLSGRWEAWGCCARHWR